jgi:hypothetical protein
MAIKKSLKPPPGEIPLANAVAVNVTVLYPPPEAELKVTVQPAGAVVVPEK